MNNPLEILQDPTCPPELRAEAGRILAQQGDPRAGVGLNGAGLPDVVWCEVPAGDFTLGDDFEAFRGKEPIQVALPRYWIAKYPVTVAQYNAFMVAGGYQSPQFWTETGYELLQGRQAPYFWEDDRFHLSNHPVVGVTWYEAYAFAQWLNQVSDGTGQIRLPTEAEWEKAARYPDGRKYPWGEKYMSGYANIDETDPLQVVGGHHLGRTAAVGSYPQGASAVGAMDLCGNVTEWLLSPWFVQYHHHTADQVNPEGTTARCWRGGSWYFGAENARAASRGWDYPYAMENALGFRLVRVAK